MAVHGALVAASAPLASSMSRSIRGSFGPGVGYLASVRDVTFYVARLDDLPADLIAHAERVTGDGRSVLYQFSVWSAERALLKGRATVVIDATIAGGAAAGAAP
jgi:predicted hotdog family 3-hydroxylacyl-ACP dehydratase